MEFTYIKIDYKKTKRSQNVLFNKNGAFIEQQKYS